MAGLQRVLHEAFVGHISSVHLKLAPTLSFDEALSIEVPKCGVLRPQPTSASLYRNAEYWIIFGPVGTWSLRERCSSAEGYLLHGRHGVQAYRRHPLPGDGLPPVRNTPLLPPAYMSSHTTPQGTANTI